MHSTGEMVLVFDDDPTETKFWCIEYRCSVCKQLVCRWSADTNDVIREVLKEEGIIREERA